MLTTFNSRSVIKTTDRKTNKSRFDLFTICPFTLTIVTFPYFIIVMLFYKFEPWESEISEYDLITRDWNDSKALQRIIEIIIISQTNKVQSVG